MMKSKLFSILLLLIVFSMVGCTPEIPEEAFTKGLKALQERNLVGAVVYFEEFCDKYPDHYKVPEAKINIATCHMQLNELDIAKEELIQIIAAYPKNDISLTAYRILSVIYLQQGDPGSAVTTLKQLRKRLVNPKDIFEISYDIADVYVRNASWEEAKEEYSGLLSDPNTPKQYAPGLELYLGKTQAKSGDIDKAIKTFSGLIESVSKSDVGIDAKVQLAIVIEDITPEESARLFNETLDIYQEVIDATVGEQEKVWARGHIAEVYFFMKNYPGAVESFKSLQKEFPNSMNIMGISQFYLDQIKEISPELFIDSSAMEEEAEPGAEESTISAPTIGSVSP